MATTVDKIRRALEKRDGIAEEEMRPLAEDYRVQVQEVNQRLDESVMLLRKGLRSEAIQRVEMTPNALDAAAELEFPEWDEWNEILQFMAVPLPPQLNHDHVAQINEAIIESLPLDALLRRHRRLAIAKAPLGVRLRTLRQIARVDANNPVWSDDVEDWEKIRLQQIDNELKSALESEDARRLYELNQELTVGKWRIAPSQRLVEQSTFAAEAHLRKKQETELGKIAPRISEAFDARNEDLARTLRTEWQAARSKYNLEVPGSLAPLVAPAMQWLEDLDRQVVIESERELAMNHLKSSLDGEQSIEEVQRAYEQASRFGSDVPEELSKRMEQLVSKPGRERKRTVQMIAAAVGVVVLLGVIGGFALLSSSNKKKAEGEALSELESLVNAERYQEALTFYTSLLSSAPETARQPKLMALRATAREAVEGEASRVQRFEKLLAQASNRDPALIDDSLLPQLQELAISDREKAQVEELVLRKDEYFKDEVMRQSDDMTAEIAQFQSQFGQLISRGSNLENQQAMQSLLTTVSRLPNRFPRHSDEVASKLQVLRDQISMRLRRMKEDGMISEQRSEAIEALMGSRSLEVFSDRLAELSTQSVARSNFVEFDKVLEEEKHWLNVESANVWLDRLGAKCDGGITAGEARELMTTATDLKKLVSPNPIFASLSRFDEDMLEFTGRRRILEDAFARMDKHPIAEMMTVTVNEPDQGPTNYLLEATWVEEHDTRFETPGNHTLALVSDAIGGSRLRSKPGPIAKPTRYPMDAISELMARKKRDSARFDSNWETTFIAIAADVTKDDNLDGVIKEWLIANLVDAAIEGSDGLRESLALTKRALDRRVSVREDWYKPRPAGSELSSEFASIMKKEMSLAYKRYADPLKEYREMSAMRLEWLGFLAKSMDGKIEYHLRGALPEFDGKLYVAVPSLDGSAKTSLQSVGTLKNGHVNLSPNPVYQVPGRPLFLFPN
ncbi:MAG: hypothetical protein AAFX06_17795 [Planctomycetota bacterium]